MEKAFYEVKKESKKSLNIFFLFVVGTILLIIGELLSDIVIGLLSLAFSGEIFNTLQAELFSFAGISLVVILWARLVEKSPWQGLGFVRKNMYKDFFIGWAFGAGMLIACVVIMLIMGVVKINGFNFSINFIIKFLVLLVAWSVQASAEEILVRGWFFSNLIVRVKSIKWAAIGSAIFFTALHLENNGINIIPIMDLFLFGILAALYMVKKNSIWGICGVHAAWNCFQGNVFSFPVSGYASNDAFIQVGIQGPSYLSGASFGVEGSIVSLIIQIIVIAWLIYDIYYKKKNNKEKVKVSSNI